MRNLRVRPLVALVAGCALLSACAATDTQRTAGETVDDSVITARVKAELVDNDSTSAGQINVQTYRGVVQLNGFVDSKKEKEAATSVARSVEGVKEVHNNLSVKEDESSSAADEDRRDRTADATQRRSTGETMDDATLTAKVKTALMEDPLTAARRINVSTYEGTVQLSGFVDSDEEKEQAEQVAERVEGVKSVRNDLEVKPTQDE